MFQALVLMNRGVGNINDIKLKHNRITEKLELNQAKQINFEGVFNAGVYHLSNQ